jgi:hypothetical protein
VDASGNVFVTGILDGTVNFGGGSLASAGSSDIFLVKFDPSGNHVWSQRFGDATEQRGYSVVADGGGNTFLTGGMQGTVNFGHEI